MRPAVYIPNFNGAARLESVLESLRQQSRPVDVVVVDNGSTDDSVEMTQESFPEVAVVALDRNLGFGTAINRAVALRPTDPILLLNNDAPAETRFVEAMLDSLTEGVEMVAGVLLQERAPELIDSAGVVADVSLMGFDYLHGRPVTAVASAPPPLGPTGGAALYRRDAFEAVGGFDERIFLYYEDVDLALRMASKGATCGLAPDARAVHAYSASLGANSSAKFAYTGWSRGYMLRRYGVMSHPRLALRALLCEGAICAGQLLMDRTTSGIFARVRGWREGTGSAPCAIDRDSLMKISTREALALRHRRRG